MPPKKASTPSKAASGKAKAKAPASAPAGAKRDASPQGIAGEEPEAKRARLVRSSKPKFNLSEANLQAAETSASVNGVAFPPDDPPAQGVVRAFWDQFPTGYLHAWLTDFNSEKKKFVSPIDVTDREKLLKILIEKKFDTQEDGAPIASKRLLQIYRKINGSKAAALDPPQATSDQSADKADEEAEEEGDQDEDEDMAEEEVERALEASRVASTSVAKLPLLPSLDASGRPLYRPVRIHNGREFVDMTGDESGHSAPARLAPCRTCASAPPASASAAAGWLCAGCGLRGDLDTGAMANQFLAKRTLQSTGTASSSSASTPSSGQSQSTKLADPLDSEFERLLAVGVPVQEFEDTGAVQPSEAIEAVRKAYKSLKYKRPSAQLQALIRAGKLPAIGYAIPALLSQDWQGHGHAGGSTVTVGADGTVGLTARGRILAQPVHTIDQFVGALVSTILPSLIDRPKAMVQWLSLATSVLAVSSEHGWNAAMTYAAELLHERIPIGEGIAKVSDEALRSLAFPSPDGRAHLHQRIPQSHVPGGSVPNRPNGSGPAMLGGACHQWNFQQTCSYGVKCRKQHTCSFSDRCGNKPEGHKGKDCPKKPGPSSVQTKQSFASAGAKKSPDGSPPTGGSQA
jgi:hypothetical protein